MVKLEPGCAESDPPDAQIYIWTGLGDSPFQILDLIERHTHLSRRIREIGAIGVIPMEDFPVEDPGRMDSMCTPAADVQFERGKAYVAIFPPKPIQARIFGNLNAPATASSIARQNSSTKGNKQQPGRRIRLHTASDGKQAHNT